MRRLFAILLLMLLPVQFSWASAAAYCQHETGRQAWHVGHHEHDAQPPCHDASGGQKHAAGIDHDCGACHAAAGLALVAELHVALPLFAAVAADGYRAALSSAPPGIPERPNWLDLA